jgi:isopentenyl diphosphate isomerase/L-lactate dehydrogenase-like FMN-dependent dehydrogenase
MAIDASKKAPTHWEKDIRAGGAPFMTLHEIVKKANQRLSQGAWDYLIGATETETTLKRNRMAIDALAFKARVCRDVSEIDCSTTFMGQKIRIPVLLAPIGGIEAFDPEGGASSAKASEAFDVPHMLSSRCHPGLEDTAAAADNFRIFQLYVRGDQDWVDDHVGRALKHGYKSFCLTVDSAHYSRRERDISTRYVKKWRARVGEEGVRYQSTLSWDHVKHHKKKYPDYPLILKGIATAEDAQMALDHGVEGIYISNHGGRQLDHGRGSIDVLPEVAAVAKGKATIFVDGSFMRGSDVVKAMALGADIVGMGRMQGLSLAAGSVDGCIRMLEIVEYEIKTCMGLIGVSSFDELDASYLHRDANIVATPHQFSALPLLNLEDDGYAPSH